MSIASHHDFRGTLASPVRIVIPKGIRFAVAPHLLDISIAFVTGYDHDRAGLVQLADAVQ